MSPVPLVFDRRLVRRRRAHSLADPRRPDFLDTAIASELVDRLSSVKRSFATILLHGGASVPLAERLDPLRGSLVLVSDCLPHPGVDLVLDEELWSIAEQRLACVIHAGGLESVNDLPGALSQIRSCLVPDGLFLAAALGGETLKELRAAWLTAESEVLGGVSPRVAPFVDVREWGTLLQRAGFALPVVDASRHIARYDNALVLMHELRALGLSNALTGRRRAPPTRSLLARVAECYASENSDGDGRIRATFEIIYLSGWSPHASQQ
ncbi:MAG: class I SAM-dependent methyltransferase, partial [Pseudomonadota bacterium]|nr:class I SAM-dependent methyltransferase [Pseudomonadota bacterium]